MHANHFDNKILHCVFDRLNYKLYTFLATCMRFILPMLIAIFFYSKIFEKTYEAKAKLKQNEKKKLKRIQESLKFSKGIFASVLMYLISVLPMSLTFLIDRDNKMSGVFYLYTFYFSRL